VERRAGLNTHDVVLLKILTNIDCVIYDIHRLLIGVLFSIRETSVAVPPPNLLHAPSVLLDDDIAVTGTSRDEFFWIRRCVSFGTFHLFRVVRDDPPEVRVASGWGARSIAVFKRLVLFRRSDINVGRQIGRAGTSASGRRISDDSFIRFIIVCTVLRLGRPHYYVLLLFLCPSLVTYRVRYRLLSLTGHFSPPAIARREHYIENDDKSPFRRHSESWLSRRA